MATPKKTRRWTSVPIPTLHGEESMDQGVVLEELTSPLGGVLWRLLRDVILWSATDPTQRVGLFAAEAGRVERLIPAMQLIARLPELKDPFGIYLRLLQVPGRLRAEEVAALAATIRDWAERQGYVGTALAFAQAAAVANPSDAHAAWAAGKLARRRADYYRAKGWFVTAIKRGRDNHQWMAYYRGHAGLGYVALQRGNLPRAEHYFLRAHRAATAHGLGDRIAGTLHNLMWVATERGDHARARNYAEAAARAYSSGDEKLPTFAGDFAYLLLEEGRFRDALHLLLAVLGCRLTYAERLVHLGNLARAAGGAREAARFRETVSTARDLTLRAEAADALADAALSIARGAAMLGEWDLAIELATQSLRAATERKEGKLALMAEAFLESAHTNRAALTKPEAPPCEPCSHVTERLIAKLPALIA
jgi:tetratricopeptide (TPR) repeat protein